MTEGEIRGAAGAVFVGAVLGGYVASWHHSPALMICVVVAFLAACAWAAIGPQK